MQQQSLAISYAAILGQMVKQLREQSGVDQRGLAVHLGVSAMSVSRIESGDAILDVPQMEKVARFFKMNPLDFFRRSLEIKEHLERKKYIVAPSKKEINENPALAVVSMAAVATLLVTVLFAKK